MYLCFILNFISELQFSSCIKKYIWIEDWKQDAYLHLNVNGIKIIWNNNKINHTFNFNKYIYIYIYIYVCVCVCVCVCMYSTPLFQWCDILVITKLWPFHRLYHFACSISHSECHGGRPKSYNHTLYCFCVTECSFKSFFRWKCSCLDFKYAVC